MENIVEKNGQGKVVIGLSGGVSSFIAAYLLKIQKYELIGITIVQKTNSDNKCFISDDDLERIKDFCKRLNIFHITVDADELFTEKVQNQWVSNQIQLRPWNVSCFSCQKMRMDLLYQKMIELSASHLCTGHFAKIFKTENEVTVHSVHDLNLDQSHILQKMDKNILSALLLPLSSLRSAEIEKLIKNFSLSLSVKSQFDCFKGGFSKEVLSKFSNLNVPGELISSDGQKLGMHEGILSLEQGKELSFNGHKFYVSFKEGGTQNIVTESESFFIRSEVKLIDVVWSALEEVNTPFFAFLNDPSTTHKIKVYPKTLGTVIVEFFEGIKLTPGEIITLYKKKGGNAKIILSGIIEFTQDEDDEGTVSLEFLF